MDEFCGRAVEDLWIQPAAGMPAVRWAGLNGLAQIPGEAALCGYRNDVQQGSYLGPAFSDQEIETYLTNTVPLYEITAAELPEKIADLIATEHVVGWFQGRMEFGPRALGSRSILGDARSPKMQKP
jgi:carbamoyltransferase